MGAVVSQFILQLAEIDAGTVEWASGEEVFARVPVRLLIFSRVSGAFYFCYGVECRAMRRARQAADLKVVVLPLMTDCKNRDGRSVFDFKQCGVSVGTKRDQ